MSDRYNRYSRPRSPVWNPARASLPSDISYGSHSSHSSHPTIVQHHHVVPLSRYENPRSSGSSFSTSSSPITTTTYKVKPDSRSTSRTRSSTVDSGPGGATIFTAVPRHRPVVHTTVVRPNSPSLKSPYRSSQEDYYAIPASSSRHDKSHHHHHRNKYSSASVDDADITRSSKEPREPSHLRVNSVRDGQAYTSPTSTSRPRERATYPATMVRHPDTVADDYGEDGYGYTNPRDLVQYDLMNNSSRQARRDSFDASGRSSRPVSITGYGEVASPRSYDNRERGPPPTTRGFDRIQSWEQPPQVRMPVPHVAPVDPIQRPARMEPPAPFEAEVAKRRSSTRRPVSMYQDDREMRQVRDDHYEARDDDPRDRRSHHKHDRYEDSVEQRGFGLRPERQDRPERPASKPERTDRGERGERSDRRERSPRPERERAERGERDMEERREKKSSTHEKVATGLSIASAALSLGAMANSLKPEDRDDRDDRDEPRRRKEYDDEPRRRRDRDDRDDYEASPREMRERRHRDDDRDSGSDRSDRRDGRERRRRDMERESGELSGRDTRERRHRDDDVTPPPRESRRHEEEEKPRESRHREDAPRDIARDGKDRHSPDSAHVDLSGRDPKERPSSSEDRPRHEGTTNGTTHDSHSETSDEGTNHRRRPRRISGAAAAPFNPRDTMDLKALKEALAGQDAPEQKEPVPVYAAAASAAQPPPRQPSPEPLAVPSKPIGRQSITKDMREVAELRAELNKEDRGRHEPSAANDNKQTEVVPPPREKPEEKPVKGILRQPREKFPEDPSPIREGVAPLKDAKKDGVPPDARWTKIARKLVNPEALEIGKERYEAREDFVIVLRVLSREEIQAYATATQQIRAAREEEEYQARRRARRERKKHERSEHGRGRHYSESDTSEEYDEDRPKMLEAAPGKRSAYADEHVMSGAL
ncbi:hypothetical protein ACMFMG_002187 [Clarireedia jacksonii]